MKNVTVYFALVAVVLIPAQTAFAAPGPSPVLGQVISQDMTMDGFGVPSGTTLLNDTLLETGSSPAAIHLGNGPVLELAESSSAFFERLPSGDVRISVETGSLSFFEGSETTTVSEAANLTIPHLTGKPELEATEGHEEEEEVSTPPAPSRGGLSGKAKGGIVVASVLGAATAIIVVTREEAGPASKLYP